MSEGFSFCLKALDNDLAVMQYIHVSCSYRTTIDVHSKQLIGNHIEQYKEVKEYDYKN